MKLHLLFSNFELIFDSVLDFAGNEEQEVFSIVKDSSMLDERNEMVL